MIAWNIVDKVNLYIHVSLASTTKSSFPLGPSRMESCMVKVKDSRLILITNLLFNKVNSKKEIYLKEFMFKKVKLNLLMKTMMTIIFLAQMLLLGSSSIGNQISLPIQLLTTTFIPLLPHNNNILDYRPNRIPTITILHSNSIRYLSILKIRFKVQVQDLSLSNQNTISIYESHVE